MLDSGCWMLDYGGAFGAIKEGQGFLSVILRSVATKDLALIPWVKGKRTRSFGLCPQDDREGQDDRYGLIANY